MIACNYFPNDKLASHLGDRQLGFSLQRKVVFKYTYRNWNSSLLEAISP